MVRFLSCVMDAFVSLTVTGSQNMVTAMITPTRQSLPRPRAYITLRSSPPHQLCLPSQFANLVLRHGMPNVLALIHHFMVTLRPQGHLLYRLLTALPGVLPPLLIA